MSNAIALADTNRFCPIEDTRLLFPELDFTGADTFELAGEELLITDPIYLADVYNPSGDAVAAHVRAVGVVVGDFGGDASCPVWWRDPYLLLPLSLTPSHDPAMVAGAIRVADEIGCDSGSFVFLPLRPDAPPSVRAAVERVMIDRNGARVRLPMGKYRVCYEQHEPPASVGSVNL